jgi:hypothetical protein
VGFELVEEIEDRLAALLQPGEFERLRDALLRIANEIDPGGGLGEGDLNKTR